MDKKLISYELFKLCVHMMKFTPPESGRRRTEWFTSKII